jgi:hypothetical protein
MIWRLPEGLSLSQMPGGIVVALRLDINLEDEILEISRSFHVLVHTARGGIVGFHFLVLKAHCWSAGLECCGPLSFNVN